MYRHLYGLTEKPFQISTDPNFLWMSRKHSEALAVLVYGVRDNKGFLLLSGAVGTGKTTLIRALLARLDRSVEVATVMNPALEPLGFFNHLAAAYGMRRRYSSKVDFLADFEAFLRRTRAAGRTALLIVDEAQRLDAALLEEIRLLSNIEDPDQKLLNIFFVGQEEFLETIAAPRNRALKQRITLNYHLERLTAEETEQLVRHRLEVAGADRDVFTPDAFPGIYAFSQGAPRLVNILCDHALLTGFVKRVDTIGADIIAECADDLCLPGERRRHCPAPSPLSIPASDDRPPPAAVTAGMMLQQPSPPRRWIPWGAALLLLTAVSVGAMWHQGWLGITTATVTWTKAPSRQEVAATAPAPVLPAPKRKAEAPNDVAEAKRPDALKRAGSAEIDIAPGILAAATTEDETAYDAMASTGPADEELPFGHEIPDGRPAAPGPENQVADTRPIETGHPATDAIPENAGGNASRPRANRIGGNPPPQKPSMERTEPASQRRSLDPSPPPASPPAPPRDRSEPAAAKAASDTPQDPPSIDVTSFGRSVREEDPIAIAALPAAGKHADTPERGTVDPGSSSPNTEDRLRNFIDSYCRAYESRDLARLRLFFAENATEQGRAIQAVLPDYEKMFRSVDAVEYAIDLSHWKADPSTGAVTFSGIFRVRYQRPGQEWQLARGDIAMALEERAGVFRIRQLEYKKSGAENEGH